MARKQSVFTGTMKFGILTIPVKLYKPHFDEETLPSAHLEHSHDGKPCGQGVQRPWYCPACESNVEYGTLLKVYDNGAVLTQAQVASAKIPEKEFTIEEFVKAEEVDAMNLEGELYYIEVDGKEALEAYSVLTFALKQSERVAIAYYAARGTDRMVVVRPWRDGLVMQFLKCANLNDAPTYGTTFSAEVIETATFLTKLIEKKTVTFEPNKYKSQHVENMRALLEKPCEAPAVAVACKPKAASLADMLKMMAEAA